MKNYKFLQFRKLLNIDQYSIVFKIKFQFIRFNS